MKLILTIVTLLLLAGCQTTKQTKPAHFLEGIQPIIGDYGYSASPGNYWNVYDTVHAENEKFGLMFLNWASIGPYGTSMWISTGPGEHFCNSWDLPSGNGAVNVNGQWVKSNVSCLGGRLSFSLEDYFSVHNQHITTAVIFDYLGNVAMTFDIRVTFETDGLLNAMRFAQLESHKKDLEKQQKADQQK